jgi:hypothetical protein
MTVPVTESSPGRRRGPPGPVQGRPDRRIRADYHWPAAAARGRTRRSDRRGVTVAALRAPSQRPPAAGRRRLAPNIFSAWPGRPVGDSSCVPSHGVCTVIGCIISSHESLIAHPRGMRPNLSSESLGACGPGPAPKIKSSCRQNVISLRLLSQGERSTVDNIIEPIQNKRRLAFDVTDPCDLLMCRWEYE